MMALATPLVETLEDAIASAASDDVDAGQVTCRSCGGRKRSRQTRCMLPCPYGQFLEEALPPEAAAHGDGTGADDEKAGPVDHAGRQLRWRLVRGCR